MRKRIKDYQLANCTGKTLKREKSRAHKKDRKYDCVHDSLINDLIGQTETNSISQPGHKKCGQKNQKQYENHAGWSGSHAHTQEKTYEK